MPGPLLPHAMPLHEPRTAFVNIAPSSGHDIKFKSQTRDISGTETYKMRPHMRANDSQCGTYQTWHGV